MKNNLNFTQLAVKATVEKTIAALAENGISAEFVGSGEEAKQRVLELLPEQAQIMNMTSMTLEGITVVKELLESGKYEAVRNQLNTMNNDTQGREKRQLGAAPDWVIGSVHAVTEDGQVMIASNTGSQLPAYAYGAAHVLWVVGTHKIVKNIDEGMQRIYEHSLPLEHERAKQAYGTGSNVSKVLIVNKEVQPDRITLIFVNEVLGF